MQSTPPSNGFSWASQDYCILSRVFNALNIFHKTVFCIKNLYFHGGNGYGLGVPQNTEASFLCGVKFISRESDTSEAMAGVSVQCLVLFFSFQSTTGHGQSKDWWAHGEAAGYPCNTTVSLWSCLSALEPGIFWFNYVCSGHGQELQEEINLYHPIHKQENVLSNPAAFNQKVTVCPGRA